MEAEVVFAPVLNPIQSFATKQFRTLPSWFPPLVSLALRPSSSLLGHTPSILHIIVNHRFVLDATLPRVHNLQSYLNDPTQLRFGGYEAHSPPQVYH